MTNEEGVTLDNVTGEVLTPTPPSYRSKLDTVKDIRKEMGVIYRQCRSGKIEAAELTKLMYSLQIMQRAIMDAEIEERLEIMEQGGSDE